MILLAIDPGVEKVGYSVFDKKVNGAVTFNYIASGLIKTARTQDHSMRLKYIYNHLASLLTSYKPNLLVIERIFFFKNQKTIVSISQAQGVILLLAAQHDIPVEYLTPLQIKQTITGYGASDKKSVRKMIELLLQQKLIISDDDESDAIACGLAYCYLNPALVK